jgi:2,4'-dihydroxyacetophenone dioxygenase
MPSAGGANNEDADMTESSRATMLPAQSALTLMAGRPIVPEHGLLDTMHVGDDDLPWIPLVDGTTIQLVHVDLVSNLWVQKIRMSPGARARTHYHTGLVFAVTLEGSWYYLESPEAVNRPGSYLFEPAGSRHTLYVPAEQSGDTVAWFAIYGANINLDEGGNIVSIVDARFSLELYRGYCEANGLDCSKLIVQGE